MGYEIERNVKIEVVPDTTVSEASYTVGLGRCATRLPAYTNEELRAGLGEMYDEIEDVFSQPD